MIRFGSQTFNTLKKINSKPLWADQGLPTNFYRLMQISLIKRERKKKEGVNFMHEYSITSKGQEELQEVETREAIKIHEQTYFCF